MRDSVSRLDGLLALCGQDFAGLAREASRRESEPPKADRADRVAAAIIASADRERAQSAARIDAVDLAMWGM